MKYRTWLQRSILLAFVTGVSLGVLGSHVRAALNFPDVEPGAYYENAAREMATLGFITGYADGNFGPNDPLTRGQGAVIMHRMWQELQRQGAVSATSTTTRSSSSRARSSSSSSSSSSAEASGDNGAFRFQTDSFSISESATTASISVIRTTGKEGAVSVKYETVAGTATEGEDYTKASGTINFANGETTKTITVSIKNDEDGEDEETLTVKLSDPSGGATMSSPDELTLTILDNDGGSGTSSASSNASVGAQGALGFAAAAYSAMEDSDNVDVRVTRTDGTTGEVSVDYSMQDNTADGGDYIDSSGTLTFADGETVKTFAVDLYDNDDKDGNKAFRITLGNITGGAVLRGNATVDFTIVDDEITSSGAGLLRFDEDAYDANEGDTVTVNVVRTTGYSNEVGVTYATSDGNAKKGSDYEEVSGTLTFQEGESMKSFDVKILTDNNNENTETVDLNLSSPTGGASLTTPSTSFINIFD